jgi:hypothetical protein
VVLSQYLPSAGATQWKLRWNPYLSSAMEADGS